MFKHYNAHPYTPVFTTPYIGIRTRCIRYVGMPYWLLAHPASQHRCMMKVQTIQQHKVDKLAADITSWVDRLEKLQGERVDLWGSIGKALINLKQEVGHGKWVAYISSNLPLDMRQCQKYMQFHRHFKDDLSQAQRFTSLNEATTHVDKLEELAIEKATAVKRKEAEDEAKAQRRETQATEKAHILATKGEAYWEQLQEAKYQSGERKDHARANREFIGDVNANHVHPPNKTADTDRALGILQMYPPSAGVALAAYDYLVAKHNPAKFKADTVELEEVTELRRELDWALKVLTETT